MSTTGIISQRYARALLKLAVQADAVDESRNGLDDVADALCGSDHLQGLLREAKISLPQKEAVMATLLERLGCSDLISRFTRLVTRKRRALLLDEIRTIFHRLADERMGRAHADVTVASALESNQHELLRKKLESLTGKQITLNVTVDEKILGGAITRIQSTVWDGSLSNQLNQIRKSISGG